jgi:hypothetical protein
MNPDDIKCDLIDYLVNKTATAVEVQENRLEQCEQLLTNGSMVSYETLVELAILLAQRFKEHTPADVFNVITLSLLKEIKQ